MQPSPPLLTAPAPPRSASAAPSDTTAKLVYVLYLVSLVVGLTALVGVIVAYVNVGDAPEPLRSHYRFQIRTLWLSLLYGIVAALLVAVWWLSFLAGAIGAASLAFFPIWFIVRCAKGLKHLARREPYPNVTTWLW